MREVGREVVWVVGACACLVVVFFLATHDPLAALQWRQTLPQEVRALVRTVSEGRMERQIAFPLLAVGGLLAMLLRSPLRWRPHPLVGGLLASFLLWALFSVAWSADPLLTGKRLLVLGMMVIGAAGLARQLPAAGLMRLVAACTGVFLLVGVVAELWLGVFRPAAAGYRFAGTLHPNQQGINCALLTLSAAALARAAVTRRGRVAASALLALGLVGLTLTRSRTALAACLIVLLLFAAMEAPPLRRAGIAALAAAGATVVLLLQINGVYSSAGRLLLLGREDSSLATFTGRTEIWSYSLRHALDRPIAGHGYNTFWSPRHTAEASHFVDWKISEAHSAYVDVLLNLGLVGLILFVALMAAGVVVAWRRHRHDGDPSTAMLSGLLLLGLLDGLLESAVVIPSFLSFVTLAVLAQLAGRAGVGRGSPPAVMRPLPRLVASR